MWPFSKPAPLTPIEEALIKSLKSETEKWFVVSNDTPLTLMNREKAIAVTVSYGVAASGKLHFSNRFSDEWNRLAVAIRDQRNRQNDEIEAARMKRQFEKALGL